jgi:hypothetical protein
LSKEEYARIKRIVFWRIPHDWCDREDALQFGLLKTLEHCDNHEFKSIKTYAVEAAYHYAYNIFFRPLNRMTVPTEDLAGRGKSDEKESYQDVWDRIAVTHDKYPSLTELDQTLRACLENQVDAF